MYITAMKKLLLTNFNVSAVTIHLISISNDKLHIVLCIYCWHYWHLSDVCCSSRTSTRSSHKSTFVRWLSLPPSASREPLPLTKKRLNEVIGAGNAKRGGRSTDGDETIADRVAWRRRKRPNASLYQTCRKIFGKKKKKNANEKIHYYAPSQTHTDLEVATSSQQ